MMLSIQEIISNLSIEHQEEGDPLIPHILPLLVSGLEQFSKDPNTYRIKLSEEPLLEHQGLIPSDRQNGEISKPGDHHCKGDAWTTSHKLYRQIAWLILKWNGHFIEYSLKMEIPGLDRY